MNKIQQQYKKKKFLIQVSSNGLPWVDFGSIGYGDYFLMAQHDSADYRTYYNTSTGADDRSYASCEGFKFVNGVKLRVGTPQTNHLNSHSLPPEGGYLKTFIHTSDSFFEWDAGSVYGLAFAGTYLSADWVLDVEETGTRTFRESGNSHDTYATIRMDKDNDVATFYADDVLKYTSLLTQTDANAETCKVGSYTRFYEISDCEAIVPDGYVSWVDLGTIGTLSTFQMTEDSDSQFTNTASNSGWAWEASTDFTDGVKARLTPDTTTAGSVSALGCEDSLFAYDYNWYGIYWREGFDKLGIKEKSTQILYDDMPAASVGELRMDKVNDTCEYYHKGEKIYTSLYVMTDANSELIKWGGSGYAVITGCQIHRPPV